MNELDINYDVEIEESDFDEVTIGLDPSEIPLEAICSFYSQESIVSIVNTRTGIGNENFNSFEEFMVKFLTKLKREALNFEAIEEFIDDFGIDIIIKDR